MKSRLTRDIRSTGRSVRSEPRRKAPEVSIQPFRRICLSGASSFLYQVSSCLLAVSPCLYRVSSSLFEYLPFSGGSANGVPETGGWNQLLRWICLSEVSPCLFQVSSCLCEVSACLSKVSNVRSKENSDLGSRWYIGRYEVRREWTKKTSGSAIKSKVR